jgi:IclR family KDG regulon transcriptional repressor
MKDPNDYNVRAVEIAQAVDLHKATAHRIVTTLVNYGYLERADDGQRYRLGLELTNLGFKVIHRMDLRREAHPYMKQLVQQWDETCDLSIFDRGELLYIEVLRGNRALNIAAAIGQRAPAHCTANGKLFLANMPPDELEAILNQPLASFTERTITSPAELRKELEIIRNQGFAIDNEEFEQGVYAISAPIYNRQGNVIATIGCPSPTSRMTPERIQEISEAFKEAARLISIRMGWNR